MTARPAARCREHAIHVDRGEDGWDVVDAQGRLIAHCRDEAEATELAIRRAHHAHGDGDDVVVCVEQADGSYALAWSFARA